MKKSVLVIICVFCFGFFFINESMAQCPGCVTGPCTASPPKPTICPAVLPDGIAMQPYDEDLSFYLPHNFDDANSGYNVDLNQLDILSVVGLPFGLSFQTDASPSNIYYPTSNPPTSEHGCGKICGTPIMPGNYTVTVFVLAHVSVGIINQTANSSFDIPITILPGGTTNNGFTTSSPFGCAPHTTGFTCNRPSNGNPLFTYSWDFGNGNNSLSENPPSQFYGNPGYYIVTLQTQIDTLPYYLESVTLNSASSCNDSPWSDPDYYFNLKLGSTTVYSSAIIDNTAAPVTFSMSPISLNNSTYTIEIWEDDTGLLGADDHCGDFTIQGHTPGTFSLTSGDAHITYTISHPVLNFTDVDTIKVFQAPILDSLTYLPNDSLCAGDSVLLSVTDAFGGLYQWYNDTNAIVNATDSSYFAKVSGYYWVEVSNSNGCRTNSNEKQITFIDNPSKPGTWIIGNTLNTNSTGVDLQWYYEGSPILWATNASFDFAVSGNYFVMATNFFGCSTSSDTVYVTYSSGIAETDVLNGVQLIPNPTSGKFMVNFETTSPEAVQINIADLTGRIVFESKFPSQGQRFSQEIDLGNVQKGIYLVEIIAGKSRGNSRLIKQ
ncbi:MAG TPA: T9SS type A sorting domain-containing protein [Bacteroidales bacterium]|nr:T9SS type A sorting domain-containing protein [Bacteroidales bacterium]